MPLYPIMYLQTQLLLCDMSRRRRAARKRNEAMFGRLQTTIAGAPTKQDSRAPTSHQNSWSSLDKLKKVATATKVHLRQATTNGASPPSTLAARYSATPEQRSSKLKRLMQSTKARLLPRTAQTAPPEYNLTVTFQHTSGEGFGCLDVLAQSEGTITVSEQMTLQEFEDEVLCQARKMVFDDDISTLRICGKLGLFGENVIALPRHWEDLKVLLFKKQASLTFRFQVLESLESDRSNSMESFKDLEKKAVIPCGMC